MLNPPKTNYFKKNPNTPLPLRILKMPLALLLVHYSNNNNYNWAPTRNTRLGPGREPCYTFIHAIGFLNKPTKLFFV